MGCPARSYWRLGALFQGRRLLVVMAWVEQSLLYRVYCALNMSLWHV